jgi:putative oxidoreductase
VRRGDAGWLSTMHDELLLVGRLMLSVVFFNGGITHLSNRRATIRYAKFKKVPNAQILAMVAPIAMLFGAVALVLGIFIDLAALCLATLVVIIAVLMHRFWEESDERSRALELAQFSKTISVAGGCLILAAIGDGIAYTLTDGVF